MKTLVCVNALTEVDSSVYLTHCQMWYRMGRDFPKDQFILYVPHRMSIDNARNTAAKIAMNNDCDYLFFIDDDMVLSENTFKSLVEADKDVVMALTYVRGYPFHPMFFIDTDREAEEIGKLDFFDNFEEFVDQKTSLVECDAIGCACVLIKVSLLRKMRAPYFVTSPISTEDVYFCLNAKKTLGRKNVSIFVDCAVPTGHLGEKVVYSYETIKKHKDRYEEDFPGVKTIPESGDRGEAYLDRNGIKKMVEV